MTTQTSVAGDCALLLRVRDRSLHGYMQQFPYCTGPDEVLNRKCFDALRESVELRRPSAARAIDALDPLELEDESSIRVAAGDILRLLGLSENECATRLESRAWKLCLARRDAESVLALGCGEGDEIAALRARAPQARIVALDWVDKTLPGLLNATKADFIHGDFNDRLAEHPAAFDLVFSNHVVEHSFDPDGLLAAIRGSMRPGGQLVCALPLDGESGNPVFEKTLSLARNPRRMKRSDMFCLAAGHSYKTNASEFAETLLASGFRAVRIAYRPSRPTLSHLPNVRSLKLSRAVHIKLHAVSAGLLFRVIDFIYSDNPSLGTLQLLGALDSRWPFGLIAMHTRKSMEAIAVARA